LSENRTRRPLQRQRGGRAVGIVKNDDRADWSEAWELFPGDVAYIWHGALHGSIVQASLEEVGFLARSQIIWVKNQFVISRGDYHFQHEPCWYAVRKGKPGGWAGDRKQTTVWAIDKPQKSETVRPACCSSSPLPAAPFRTGPPGFEAALGDQHGGCNGVFRRGKFDAD
jgi:hypothetical protein